MPIPDSGQQAFQREKFTPEVYPDHPMSAPADREDNTMKKKQKTPRGHEIPVPVKGKTSAIN